MPIKKLLAIIIVTLALTGCFIANEVFTEKPEVNPYSNLQGLAESNITNQINTELSDTDVYKPYGFTKLKVIKPLAIAQLDSLENAKILNPDDTSITRLIREKKAFIQQAGIERTASIEHIFTITSDTNAIHILELKYFLNDTLGITDSKPTIILDVPLSYELIIEYFYNEHTILMAQSYAEGRKMSRTFYYYFKSHLETFQTITGKSNFLKHCLNVCIEVKRLGVFDQNEVTQSILERHIREDRKDITDYEPLAFSQLYQSKNNVDSSLVGYYFFHKFIGNYADQIDTNVVLVEFSPYYEVSQIFQMEGTFESYVNNN